MEFISLFSGIGGFDLGFTRVGMVCKAQVEIDKFCQQVLRRHFPGTELHDDIKTYAPNRSVDLICGGFPCTDVSIAGKRAGLVGEQSGLWYEFLRVLTIARPRWTVIENVPGLLSSNEGWDFAAILHGLAECGYGVAWRVLDAQYFGVPQHRERVFIVGSLGSGRSAQVLFESESGGGNTAQGRKTGQEIAHTITACTSSSGRYEPSAEDYIVCGALNAHSKRHGHAMTTQQAAQSGQLIPMVFNWQSGGDARGLAISDKPMLQCLQKPAVMFNGVRRLTPTECARVQGFPDDYLDGQSDSAKYRMLGNAVNPQNIEWIGGNIIREEKSHD